MRRRDGSNWSAAIVLLTVALIVAGCGLKGDPKPPQIMAPPPIADLKAEPLPRGISIAWTVTDRIADVGSFKILRSVTLDGSLACPECPQDYQPLATPAVSDTSLSREGEKGFKYFDATVRDGSYYSYRIQACSRSGQCSAPSNEAGLVYRKVSEPQEKGQPASEPGPADRKDGGPREKGPSSSAP